MSFYVTLPSNASTNIYPDNHPGHFFVKLPQPIQLSTQYEIGLAEIQFPGSYFNVLEDDIWIEYIPPKELNQSPLTLKLAPGLYTAPETFIDELNKLMVEMEGVGKTKLRFSFNKTSKKATLRIYEEGAKARISDMLKNVLGVNSSQTTDEEPFLIGEGDVKLETEFMNVYVYSDIIAARPVGNMMVPLLRAVPIIERPHASVFRIYDKPHYLAPGRFTFDTIEILITNEEGKTIPFASGASILTLHFRTRRHFDID